MVMAIFKKWKLIPFPESWRCCRGSTSCQADGAVLNRKAWENEPADEGFSAAAG
jgi:hypothetical protein